MRMNPKLKNKNYPKDEDDLKNEINPKCKPSGAGGMSKCPTSPITSTSSCRACWSCTRESVQNLPRKSLGGRWQSVAHRSGLTLYPCCTLPTV